MTAQGGGERVEDEPIVVELAIDDDALAGRVRSALMASPDLSIAGPGSVPAGVLVTDGEVEVGKTLPAVVITAGRNAMRALRAGAAAVLPKHASAAELVAAIRGVALGFTVIGPDLRDELIRGGDTGVDDEPGLAPAEDEPAAIELTRRELQVLALLADGASNKAIARALAITPHTAKFHVASIVAKLGVTGRTEAVAKAMRMGLLMV